jgi:SH3-like domain-containing protein/tetratricopeptide (TPR) repeat protein
VRRRSGLSLARLLPGPAVFCGRGARLLFAGLALCFFPVAAGAADPLVQADRGQVNVRADATVQSGRIAVLSLGQEVEWVRRKDEWYQVRLPDQRNGWVHADLVRELWVASGDGVRVRRGPATSAVSMTMMAAGEELNKVGQSGDWLEVALPDGRRGFVLASLVRAKTKDADDSSAANIPATVREEAPAPVKEVPESGDPIRVERNAYATGLQSKADGDLEEALASFSEVLAENPDHLNALFHAAETHKILGQYDEALARSYHALAQSGPQPDVRYYLVLGDIYRLMARPDSARKYQAMFRGETWIGDQVAAQISAQVNAQVNAQNAEANEPLSPEKQVRDQEGEEAYDLVWLLVLAAVATGILGLAAAILWRRSSAGEPPKDETFARDLAASAASGFEGIGEGEEEELERQIEEKWRALRLSSAALGADDGSGKDEDMALDTLLERLEGLRGDLSRQDERSELYADIVRLQNMRIESLKDEIRLMRRSRGRS